METEELSTVSLALGLGSQAALVPVEAYKLIQEQAWRAFIDSLLFGNEEGRVLSVLQLAALECNEAQSRMKPHHLQYINGKMRHIVRDFIEASNGEQTAVLVCSYGLKHIVKDGMPKETDMCRACIVNGVKIAGMAMGPTLLMSKLFEADTEKRVMNRVRGIQKPLARVLGKVFNYLAPEVSLNIGRRLAPEVFLKSLQLKG